MKKRGQKQYVAYFNPTDTFYNANEGLNVIIECLVTFYGSIGQIKQNTSLSVYIIIFNTIRHERRDNF